MPHYRFQAQNVHGETVNGEVSADEPSQAIARLAGDGFRGISLIEAAEKPRIESAGPAAEAGSAAVKPLSGELATELGETLSVLMQSGLSLEAGLQAAARELPRSPLTRVLDRLADRLHSGQTLPQALESLGGVVPAHLRGLLLAGLSLDNAAGLLEQMVAYGRRSAAIRRRLWIGLGYPALLLAMVAALFALFSTQVIPQFKHIFDDFNLTLPVNTRLFVGMSEVGSWILAANLAAVGIGWVVAWLASDAPTVRRMLNHLPLLGPVLRWTALVEFLRLLALLVEGRLPLATAVRLSGGGSRDADLNTAASAAAARVELGATLSAAVHGLPQIPASLGPVVAWGEQVGALPAALRTAADMFEGRLETQLVLIRVVVPPLAFLLVLGFLLFLISSTLLPMYNLIQKLF